MVFFIIMKKLGFKIVLMNINLLSIEGTLMIHSYLLARSITSKNLEIIWIVNTDIKYTSSTKIKNSTSFLGIKITRDNNKFITSVNRKPTFSVVFTNFGSFIPNLYKYNLLFALLHRAFKLCSNFERFHQEIDKLKTIFENNGYPKCFVAFCIKTYLDKVLWKRK